MKISGFTFLRNGEMLGYPFIESIKSALPLCDEFVVNVGPCEDDTLAMVRSIGDPKIRIIESTWNEGMRTRGFIYSQQTNLALFNTSGDWALSLQGDEVLHEDDLPKIRKAMEDNLDDPRVDGLVFDYIHFYGNHSTYAWSPAWYRREVRAVRNTIPVISTSDAQYFVVLDSNRKGRYPRVKPAEARIFHYGWVRSEEQMNAKLAKVEKYWGKRVKKIDYGQIDQSILRQFSGSHPAVMADWLPKEPVSLFQADQNHPLTKREKRHRVMLKLESLFGLELSKKHYRLVR